jgi:hypothetical protein
MLAIQQRVFTNQRSGPPTSEVEYTAFEFGSCIEGHRDSKNAKVILYPGGGGQFNPKSPSLCFTLKCGQNFVEYESFNGHCRAGTIFEDETTVPARNQVFVFDVLLSFKLTQDSGTTQFFTIMEPEALSLSEQQLVLLTAEFRMALSTNAESRKQKVIDETDRIAKRTREDEDTLAEFKRIAACFKAAKFND